MAPDCRNVAERSNVDSWLITYYVLLILILQAEIYEHEGNDQQTYFLLFRHAQLVLRYLSAHPDARQLQNRLTLALANKEVEKSLAKLEVLKPRLNKRYERYEQLLRDRDIRTATTSGSENTLQQNQKISIDNKNHHDKLIDPTMPGTTETLVAEDNRDLAVKLARKEIKRRATAKRAIRQAGVSEEEEQERRTAGLWGNWEEALVKNGQGIDQDTLSKQMQKLRSQVDGRYTAGPPKKSSFPSLNEQRPTYRYPLVPEISPYQDQSPYIQQSTSSKDLQLRQISSPVQVPELPPKDKQDLPNVLLATRSQQENGLEQDTPARLTIGTPMPDLQPSTFTFKPSAYLENGTPLRTIFLPPDLRFRFLSLALPNTLANLETCGILCGTLISNALFISKLVIPDQESTSDTCETVNEDKLFDFVDGEDLMVLGWIHTHPTQTCFMSSRDLHTHSGYQVMMPESIAIVCAPSKGEYVRIYQTK